MKVPRPGLARDDVVRRLCPIAIDPKIGYVRSALACKDASGATIADRIDPGETVDALAEDCELSRDEIEQADATLRRTPIAG